MTETEFKASVGTVEWAYDGNGFQKSNPDFSVLVETTEGNLLIECAGLDQINEPNVYALPGTTNWLKDATTRFFRQNRKTFGSMKEFGTILVSFLKSQK